MLVDHIAAAIVSLIPVNHMPLKELVDPLTVSDWVLVVGRGAAACAVVDCEV